MDGMTDGHPTFGEPLDDDLTPEEREAQRLYLRPINPDPVAALAAVTRRHDCEVDECVIGKTSGECVLVGSLVGTSPLREEK